MKRLAKEMGIHLIKHVPFCQSLGSLVAIYNTARSWDIIILHCLIFHLHYMLLQRFKRHAESKRKPFHQINIYDCVICQHLQTLTQTVEKAGESHGDGQYCCCAENYSCNNLSGFVIS